MVMGCTRIYRFLAGDLGHSRSVSPRLRLLFFFLLFRLKFIMSVSSAVQEFINDSLVQNNKSLLEQISKLVADSAENIKRSSVEAADEQLREIKKLRREEPKAFQRKGNEIQYKFNSKLQLRRLKRRCQKVRQCSPKGKSLSC